MSRHVLFLLGAAALLLAAKRPEIPSTIGPSVAPMANVYLRNAFDTDPSRLVGRFVPDGLATLDDSNGSKKACSQFVSHTVVGGGNMKFDEVYAASTQATLNLGFPPVAGLNASGGAQSLVRVTYTLAHKMVSDIEDPAGFEACCKKAPDQCTGRYLGEFLEGTGAVWQMVEAGGKGKAGVLTPQVSGKLEVSRGVSWRQAFEFSEPVYFAFKTTDTGWNAGPVASGCGAWTDAPPLSSQGHYFVGISERVGSDRLSREQAMLDARRQVVQWVSSEISEGRVRKDVTEGALGALRSKMTEEGFLQESASGVAAYVKDQNWCAKPGPGDGTTQAWVLAFLPNAEVAAAADALMGAESGHH